MMVKTLGKIIYKVQEFIRKGFYKVFRESVIKASFESCGKDVHIAEKCNIKGIENINIKNNVTIGPNSLLWTTGAKIFIKDKVIIGPKLSIITGNHKINMIGKYMADITVDEKDECDDQDVIIERDVWIGANVTILKGVTITEGCVIGSGTILTKSTEPYGVYAGVPGKRIAERFTTQEIEEHRKQLNLKE